MSKTWVGADKQALRPTAMKPWRPWALGLALALPALCAFALLPTQAFGQNNNPKPQASRSVKHAESRPLRDLPATGPEVEKPNREHPVKPIPQPEQRTTSVADPGLQTGAQLRSLAHALEINAPDRAGPFYAVPKVVE